MQPLRYILNKVRAKLAKCTKAAKNDTEAMGLHAKVGAQQAAAAVALQF